MQGAVIKHELAYVEPLYFVDRLCDRCLVQYRINKDLILVHVVAVCHYAASFRKWNMETWMQALEL